MMFRIAVLGTVVLGLTLATQGRAEEVPVKKPLGTWIRKAGEATLKFEIKPEELLVTVDMGGQKIELLADYGMSKDGFLFGRARKVTKSTGDGPEEGDLFAFRVKVKDGKLVLSDLKAGNSGDDARQLVEGEYEKAK